MGQLDSHSHHRVGGREDHDPVVSPSEHVSHCSLRDIVQGDHVKGSKWGISWEAATTEGSIRGLKAGWGKGDGLMVSSGRCRWEKSGRQWGVGAGTRNWNHCMERENGESRWCWLEKTQRRRVVMGEGRY